MSYLLNNMNTLEMNIMVLAYLGDTIYENHIRKYLISKNIKTVELLQKKSLNYVSAKNQAKILKELQNNGFFTIEEESIIKRARNYKSKSHPKSCDIITYKHATALEAVIGYLEIIDNNFRLEEMMKEVIKIGSENEC